MVSFQVTPFACCRIYTQPATTRPAAALIAGAALFALVALPATAQQSNSGEITKTSFSSATSSSLAPPSISRDRYRLVKYGNRFDMALKVSTKVHTLPDWGWDETAADKSPGSITD